MSDFNLEHYRPVSLDDLVRVGRPWDGGYVLPRRNIQKTNVLLSFGVNDDWSFEEGFEELRGGGFIYCFDYSIKDSWFVAPAFKKTLRKLCGIAVNALSYSIIGNGIVARHHVSRLGLRGRFRRFFEENDRHFFIPKFVDRQDSEKHVTVRSVFDMLKPDDLSVFVKMDIEGGEYVSLPDMEPYLNKINGLVVEFHYLGFCWNRFEDIMTMLSRDFFVAHVHANNYSGMICGTNISTCLEITMVNRKLMRGEAAPSTLSYPLQGLDFPCDPCGQDYPVTFGNNSSQ
jgi:hypothetical protein